MDLAVEKLLEKWEKLFQKFQQQKEDRAYSPSVWLSISAVNGVLLKREDVEGRTNALLCVFI